MIRGLLVGAAAGAAGTTALHAATYLDMVLRRRASSTTPEQTVEAIADRVGLGVPGDPETRGNRLQGLGALGGIVTGVAVGALAGAARSAGVAPGRVWGPLGISGLAMAGANVAMARLGITNPSEWTTADWAADVLPHLAYGVVTHAVLVAADG